VSGAEGEGGVKLYPNKSKEYYAWGFGHALNNHVEQWSLWMGLTLLNKNGIFLLK
jgi:hypothetical protein